MAFQWLVRTRAALEDASAVGGRNEEGGRGGGLEGSLWVMQWGREDGQVRAVAWVVAHQTRKKTWGSWGGVGCGERTVSGGKTKLA